MGKELKMKKAMNEAGYMLFSVSYRYDNDNYGCGGKRAISFEVVQEVFGEIPDMGETISHAGDSCTEVMYTRIR